MVKYLWNIGVIIVARGKYLWNIGGIILARGKQIVEHWWNNSGKGKTNCGILVE
jgi:hypothetical protein